MQRQPAIDGAVWYRRGVDPARLIERQRAEGPGRRVRVPAHTYRERRRTGVRVARPVQFIDRNRSAHDLVTAAAVCRDLQTAVGPSDPCAADGLPFRIADDANVRLRLL